MISSKVIRKFPPWAQPKLGITECLFFSLFFFFKVLLPMVLFHLGWFQARIFQVLQGKRNHSLVLTLLRQLGLLVRTISPNFPIHKFLVWSRDTSPSRGEFLRLQSSSREGEAEGMNHHKWKWLRSSGFLLGFSSWKGSSCCWLWAWTGFFGVRKVGFEVRTRD